MKIKAFAAAAAFVALSHSAVALPLSLTPYGFGLFDSSSWLAGAVAGYNWQQGSLVFGFEGDISGTNLVSRTTDGFMPSVGVFPPTTVFPSGYAEAKIDWYGTVRGRLGFAVGSFLLYGTGGLAYGDVSLTNNYLPGGILAALNSQTSGVRAGWVAGAGVDYLLTRNLVLNFEYQYVDLGSISLAALTAPVGNVTGPGANVHANFQAVTLGVSWKFSQPESAMASMNYKAAPVATSSNPWQGIYVGGRAGGAWGNSLGVKQPDRGFLPPV